MNVYIAMFQIIEETGVEEHLVSVEIGNDRDAINYFSGFRAGGFPDYTIGTDSTLIFVMTAEGDCDLAISLMTTIRHDPLFTNEHDGFDAPNDAGSDLLSMNFRLIAAEQPPLPGDLPFDFSFGNN